MSARRMVPSRIVAGTFRSIATWWDSFDMLSPPRLGATGTSAALLRPFGAIVKNARYDAIWHKIYYVVDIERGASSKFLVWSKE